VQTGVPEISVMPDVDGTYIINLRVSDGVVTSAPDTIVITTPSFNAVPVALAQFADGRAEVSTGTEVMLDGRGSTDADLSFLTYRWSLIVRPRNSRAVLSDPAIPNPLFTADVAGAYIAQLIVNDFVNASPPATVLLVAAPRVNRPPCNSTGLVRATPMSATC